MPLISIQEMIPGVRIALWKPEETPEELVIDIRKYTFV